MKLKIFTAAILLVLTPAIHSQQVIKIDKTSDDLANQFRSIISSVQPKDGFWIGYSIQINSENQFFIGSYLFNEEENIINLRDVINNTNKFRNYSPNKDKIKGNRNHGKSFRINHSISISYKGTDKETAILFKYDYNSKSIYDFEELVICNLSLYVDFGNHTVYWLGKTDNKNSLDYMFDLYKNVNDTYFKKELISGVGIHIDQQETTSFLKNIIYGKSEKELREHSIFWLSCQNNNEAFTTLKKLISSDPSIEIRKDAVISLSNMKIPGATEELINIARHNGESELRKHAVYGLGNIAVKQAEDALKNIIENDPDIEIKKHAVYSLANTSNNVIPYLIKLAKTHPSLSIRKSAIWSLGNSDDKRAIDALIEMAKN